MKGWAFIRAKAAVRRKAGTCVDADDEKLVRLRSPPDTPLN